MAKRVSTDHKISNQSEQERIRKEGGLILKGRVGGQLAVTRALGDLMLKSEVRESFYCRVFLMFLILIASRSTPPLNT
jgi:serine/threonine protein phosphatase PrpC